MKSLPRPSWLILHGARMIPILLVVWAAAIPVLAQRPSVDVEESACLPAEGNAPITAEVSGASEGMRVQLYFRRLNPLGAFYYNRMFTAGGGRYWSVFPKPERRSQPQLTEEWWRELQKRDWMEGRDRAWLEEWLRQQRHEAAEYYVAVISPDGKALSRSRLRLVGVSDPEDCPVELGPRERGWARNLTVGETTQLQLGNPVLHWLCDGIVSRIGANGVLRGDDFCRACVIADHRARETRAPTGSESCDGSSSS